MAPFWEAEAQAACPCQWPFHVQLNSASKDGRRRCPAAPLARANFHPANLRHYVVLRTTTQHPQPRAIIVYLRRFPSTATVHAPVGCGSVHLSIAFISVSVSVPEHSLAGRPSRCGHHPGRRQNAKLEPSFSYVLYAHTQGDLAIAPIDSGSPLDAHFAMGHSAPVPLLRTVGRATCQKRARRAACRPHAGGSRTSLRL